MEWHPEAEPLNTLATVLRDSLGGQNEGRKHAEQILRQAKTQPEFSNYLTYLTVHADAPTSLGPADLQMARHAGAVLLKNTMKNYSAISEISKSYVKWHIVEALRDETKVIRSAAGSVITEIVRQGSILDWPQLLPQLGSLVINESTPQTRDGAMGAIVKVCEDNKRALDKAYQTTHPLGELLPNLLKFTQHTDPQVRSKALAAINVFLTDDIALTVKEHINAVVESLIACTADNDEEVRRAVCRAFALLANGMPLVLQKHIAGLVQFSLIQQRSSNPDLQLEAAEFFYEASSKNQLVGLLEPHLPEIIPLLLEGMIYSEEDQLRLEGDEDDADQEDNEQDIRPQFATSKRNQIVSEELSDGEIEEDDLGDPEDEWSLRKCSAATLDNLALHFGGIVFELTLPWLTANLQHPDWQNREAAVLALGAIGPGTMDNVQPHLPQLIPYIITQLRDKQAVVRVISSWTLSRFSSWAVSLDPAGKQQYFEPMLDGILQRMLDSNKKVQESAAAAFATVEEAAGPDIVPYCRVIIQQFVKAFHLFKDRNIYLLYQCVETLATHAGPHLAQSELVQLLMPALMARWEKVRDSSQEIFSLLECLSYIATALGAAFVPYAKPLFDRCIRIIHENLTEAMSAANNPYLDEPDKDFLVTSLDLLSAILQALSKEESLALVKSSPISMIELLGYCMKDQNNDVRQSAFALLGDCAIYIFPQLSLSLATLMELVIAELDLNQLNSNPDSLYRVINNACWSAGEIAMRSDAGLMAAYIDRLLQSFMTILYSEQTPQTLKENAAIAIGRLGYPCHQHLAPMLSQFAPAFLHTIRSVSWTDEKATAMHGLSLIVLDNPRGMDGTLLELLMEIAGAPKVLFDSMQADSPQPAFEAVLKTFKSMLAEFNQYLSSLPPTDQHNLRVLYSF